MCPSRSCIMSVTCFWYASNWSGSRVKLTTEPFLSMLRDSSERRTGNSVVVSSVKGSGVPDPNSCSSRGTLELFCCCCCSDILGIFRVRVNVILGKQVKSDLNFHGKTLIQLFHVY